MKSSVVKESLVSRHKGHFSQLAACILQLTINNSLIPGKLTEENKFAAMFKLASASQSIIIAFFTWCLALKFVLP